VEGFAVPEAGDLLRPLWRQSFVGWTGLSGILYYELFRKAFSHFRNAADCLYFLEMHAWEKALNAAKGTQNPGMRTIGFQHAAVSRNHFFYIHNAAETKRTGQAADLPLPDVFACNGQRPCDTFSRQGHPDVRPVEAVRELHLIPIVKHGFRPKAAPPVLLLVGSLDRWETQSMILLLHAAFPRREGFRIWLRGHPMFPSQRAFEGLELNPAEWGCELKEDPVHDLLAVATIVMGGESSVNLEALAYGCQVVAPVLNNAMFMSPLGGSEEFYHRVCDPEELRRAVKDILAGRSSRKSLQEARRLVEEHWNLDESLARWRELLSLKGEPSGRTGQAVSV
jgi:surface carbohydrate biosynthesis protein (TIGR04326 family)